MYEISSWKISYLSYFLTFLTMSTTVQSSFGYTHSYDGKRFSEHVTYIPQWEFENNPNVTEVLSKSVAGYVEASTGGTKISYVTEKK